MSFLCPYCGREKPDTDRSQEHVIPRALGGAIMPQNPFSLLVCRRCNSACGRHVDGPFIRSWLTQLDRFAYGKRYIDLKSDSVVPLAFLGEASTLQWQGKICDYWEGPARDMVFHFHDRYPDTDGVHHQVGRPLSGKSEDIDRGFVVLFIAATNQEWWPCILRSVVAQFDDTPIYVPNCVHVPFGSPQFAAVPESLFPLVEQLRATFGKPIQNRFSIQIDAGDRFLAKLAIGLGTLFLSPHFITSQDATLLRNFMWEQKADDREALQLHGTAFFENFAGRQAASNQLNNLLGWKAGHLILFQAFDRLGLSVMLYGSQSATISVSSTQEHWDGRVGDAGGPGGTAFLVAPGFQRAIGPFPLSRYVAASLELRKGNVINEVGRFMHEIESHPAPPPPDFDEPPSDPPQSEARCVHSDSVLCCRRSHTCGRPCCVRRARPEQPRSPCSRGGGPVRRIEGCGCARRAPRA